MSQLYPEKAARDLNHRFDNDASGAVTDKDNRTLVYLVEDINELLVYPAPDMQISYPREKPVPLHHSNQPIRVLINAILSQRCLCSCKLLCDCPRTWILGIFQLQSSLFRLEVIVKDDIG